MHTENVQDNNESKAVRHELSSSDSFREQIKNQVSSDITRALNSFDTPKEGLKIIAKQTAIHEKTLRRIIAKENKPGYKTLFRVYRYLLDTNSDAEVLKKAPLVIKKYLKNNNSNITIEHTVQSDSVDQQLQRNPLLISIFLLAASGGISKEYISYQYGKYGESLFEKMVEDKILVQVNTHKYVLGQNRPSYQNTTTKKILQHLIDNFIKPESAFETGNNFYGFHTEGLNKQAYKEWLKLDEEYQKKKILIADDPKNHGDIKAFSVFASDILTHLSTNLKN